MLLYKVYGLISPFFRKRRLAKFVRELAVDPATTILDVGGYPYTWAHLSQPARITLLNLHVLPDAKQYVDRFDFVVGDGRALQYAVGTFDIAYSNSVIEHLSTWENQQLFAREVRRVGRKVWVQTPARCFWIEPHLLVPFIHYLPRHWRRRLARRFTVWGWLTRPTRHQAEAFVDEIRLLNKREMQELFPDCIIERETFFGLTKSYLAIRK